MPDHTTKETFEEAPVPTKLNLLFDEIRGLGREVLACHSEMEPRVKRLENRRALDTKISAGAGFIGGATAMLAKLIFWRD